MDQALTIAFVVIAAIVGAFLVLGMTRRRSQELKRRFGTEYDRLVAERGGPRRAEAELAAREARIQQLQFKTLSESERNRFQDAWTATQARFVDDPKGAVAGANRLVKEVMLARGYPVADFEHRVADVSVDHPHLVSNYRAAHDIAIKSQRGIATTEELRRAVVHYRALFEELLEPRESEEQAS
jgi:hypothetical protein